jgi:F-type H+-transporting ATPase subunit a
MFVIMIPVEIISMFSKPFALCIRLFANMMGGHVVILSLLALIFIMGSLFVVPVSVGFVLFINLLELLVAFIQAYIFTMLTSLFIGMSVHPH